MTASDFNATEGFSDADAGSGAVEAFPGRREAMLRGRESCARASRVWLVLLKPMVRCLVISGGSVRLGTSSLGVDWGSAALLRFLLRLPFDRG